MRFGSGSRSGAVLRWALVIAALSTSIGCERHGDAAPGVATAPDPVRALPGKAPVRGKFCPGGLLCEDDKRLFGFRVPWICSHRQASQRIARCSMRHMEWALVVEFFRSRYANIRQRDGVVEITGLRGVSGPEAVTKTNEEGLQPPTLLVQKLPNAIEITAVRGDAQLKPEAVK